MCIRRRRYRSCGCCIFSIWHRAVALSCQGRRRWRRIFVARSGWTCPRSSRSRAACGFGSSSATSRRARGSASCGWASRRARTTPTRTRSRPRMRMRRRRRVPSAGRCDGGGRRSSRSVRGLGRWRRSISAARWARRWTRTSRGRECSIAFAGMSACRGYSWRRAASCSAWVLLHSGGSTRCARSSRMRASSTDTVTRSLPVCEGRVTRSGTTRRRAASSRSSCAKAVAISCSLSALMGRACPTSSMRVPRTTCRRGRSMRRWARGACLRCASTGAGDAAPSRRSVPWWRTRATRSRRC